MATIINGDMDMFDQLVHGTIYRVPQEQLQAQEQQFMNSLVPSARGFFQKAWDFTAQMANNRAVHRARAAARKVQSIWETDAIRVLSTIGEFQNAPQSMRRFLMAEPTVRTMWKDQLLDGYDDAMAVTRDESNEDLLEYCQVMDGEMIETPDDDDYAYKFISFHDDILDDEPNLRITHEEKMDIRDSWDNLRNHVLYGDEDPTSPVNDPIVK